MFKLLLKYMIGLIILAIISIIVLYFIANKIQQRGLEQTIQTMNQGVFYSLQQQLKSYPETQWPTIIKQLHPQYGNEVIVLPLSAITLPKNQMQQLLKGKLVVTAGNSIFYFGYGTQDTFSYQRIGTSDYVLRLQEIPISLIAHYVSAWMAHLISLDLKTTPKDEWQNKINQLQKVYNVPLSLVSSSDLTVVERVRTALKTNDFVLGNPDTRGEIKYAYSNINNSGLILKIGPIPYPVYAQYPQYILIIIFSIIAIAFVIFLTFIFSRNLDKIYQITKKYSQGDFSEPPAFSRHSTLRTLHDNILQMGNKIKNLMESQRNLTRFVAHECRTPISTMLFAIDSLEKEPLSEKGKTHLDSIKNDLSDLNALVAEFLNYARYGSEELKLNYQNMDVSIWMQSCIDKYKDAPKKITFHSNVKKGTTIAFDPDLMKHVIYNLINNAIKHAHSQIAISLEFRNNVFCIHVDDDGRKIDDAEKNKIFSPFVRLDMDEEKFEQGFGLGLTIAQTIVQRHHRNIFVTDSSLGGTRFIICL